MELKVQQVLLLAILLLVHPLPIVLPRRGRVDLHPIPLPSLPVDKRVHLLLVLVDKPLFARGLLAGRRLGARVPRLRAVDARGRLHPPRGRPRGRHLRAHVSVLLAPPHPAPAHRRRGRQVHGLVARARPDARRDRLRVQPQAAPRRHERPRVVAGPREGRRGRGERGLGGGRGEAVVERVDLHLERELLADDGRVVHVVARGGRLERARHRRAADVRERVGVGRADLAGLEVRGHGGDERGWGRGGGVALGRRRDGGARADAC